MQSAYGFVLSVIVLILVVGAAPAPAQSLLADEVAGESASEFTEAKSPESAVVLPAPVPDAPTPRKVIDKKFIAVMAALGGAESLRVTTHKLVLDHEFAAGAPWVTSVPGNKGLIGKNSAIYAAELFAAYELKKPHSWLPGDKIVRKLWWVYPATMATIHIKNGIGSIRTQAPSECPPDMCAGQ